MTLVFDLIVGGLRHDLLLDEIILSFIWNVILSLIRGQVGLQ